MLKDQTLPPEPNTPIPTSAIWKDRPTETHKYIDDSIIDSRINMETVRAIDGKRIKHAVST